MPLHAGMILVQRYKVIRPLGEGGQGAAHLVEDQRLSRRCVIKEVLMDDTTSWGQFEREAQLLANLQHANLPVVHDYFFDQDHPYLVMQYVEGMTLNRLQNERSAPFEIHDVLKWAQDLLDALVCMHGQDVPVIHRDIKPHNVCITPQGKAVLLDFGIARRLDETKTNTAAQALTTGYAPIEQYPENRLLHMPSVLRYVQALHAQGIRTGPYTDVYGLGATLYYALTLLPPPDACLRVLGEEPPPIQERNPEVPEFLAAAVTRALALHPTERFQAAEEMLEALQPQTEEPSALRLRTRRPRSLPSGNIVTLDQELIYIPAGRFLLGSDDLELKEACRPQHPVESGPYCIGHRPVTHADYQVFVDNNPDYPVPYSPMRYAQRYNWDRRSRTYPRGLEDHPVVLVSWADALAYCRWLSEVSGYRCRLPTEAEWEKAACWDPDGGRARRYPWGDSFEDGRCNVDAHGELRLESSPVRGFAASIREVLKVHPDGMSYGDLFEALLPRVASWDSLPSVLPEIAEKTEQGQWRLREGGSLRDYGRYSPSGDSPYGLVDMAGNVWEWTGSLYWPYPYDPGDGREDLGADGERVVRGGAYDEGPLSARSAWRNGVKPELKAANIGFRVVCDAD